MPRQKSGHICFPKLRRTLAHFRQRALRYFEEFTEFEIPLELTDVEEERAARVGEIRGKNFAACESVDEIRVNIADNCFTALELRGDGRFIFDKPAKFRSREVSVNFQPGLCCPLAGIIV